MHLEWSLFALSDREAIFDYIEADSPRAAISIDDRIEARVEDLAQFPEMGRIGRLKERASLLFPARPILQPIESSATLFGYCAFCTALSNGQMRCLKCQKYIPTKQRAARKV